MPMTNTSVRLLGPYKLQHVTAGKPKLNVIFTDETVI